MITRAHRRSARILSVLLTLLVVLLPATTGFAQSETSAPCDDQAEACPIVAESEEIADTAVDDHTLLFFWGVGCPHCEAAKPFLAELAREEPRLRIESIEVRQSDQGRARFLERARALSIAAPGVPTFVFGDELG